MATTKKKNGVANQIISYLRKTGVISLLMGGAGMLMGPDFFWWAVGFIYLGFILLAVDIWYEPWPNKWIPGVFFLIVLGIALGFTVGWVLIDAPIDVTAMVVDAEYPEGQLIGGIPWRKEFTELDLKIYNSSSRPYTDVELTIQPNMPIAAMAQITNISDILIESFGGTTLRQALIEGKTGNKRVNPLILKATDAGYRVYCGKIPPKTQLELVVAIADVRWNPSPPTPQPPSTDFGIFEKDYVLRLKMDDGTTYWYGHEEGNPYTPRPRADTLKIKGNYVANQRKRTVDLKVNATKLEVPRHISK